MIALDYNLVLYLQVTGFVQVHNGAVECFPAVPQCTLLNNREIIYWREWADSCISLFCMRSCKDMKAAIILTLANTIKKFWSTEKTLEQLDFENHLTMNFHLPASYS